MSMLDSFCASHSIRLRDISSSRLVSEALYRSLKFKVSRDIKRDASIGYFEAGDDIVSLGVAQALDNTSLYKILKYYYDITEYQIDTFIGKLVVSTAKDLLFSSYCIFSISFPYQDYLKFISYGLTETALSKLNMEKQSSLGVVYSVIKDEYKEIFSEVTLAVNAYYAVSEVARELAISEDEAKQKILYIISNKSSTSIFNEYYRNILGETKSVPSTSACKIIRPYLQLEEV